MGGEAQRGRTRPELRWDIIHCINTAPTDGVVNEPSASSPLSSRNSPLAIDRVELAA
jgi:hypothetical protein